MADPERIYEKRDYPVGWRHRCENPECGTAFTSKRKAYFCSAACRSSNHDRVNRLAREFAREHGVIVPVGSD